MYRSSDNTVTEIFVFERSGVTRCLNPPAGVKCRYPLPKVEIDDNGFCILMMLFKCQGSPQSQKRDGFCHTAIPFVSQYPDQ